MSAATQTLRRVDAVMGTVVSILTRAPAARAAAVAAAVDAALAGLHEDDDRFTTWRPDSEWLRLCRGELAPEHVHPDVHHVLERAAALAEVTGGAFCLTADPQRPPDPAAYVKGWALQKAADTIVAAGADAVCVNGGGDVALFSRDEPWRVGVQDPGDPGRLAAVIELHSGAVATSGTYERGQHIYDPLTARPATALASVTVLGPDLGLADAYSTAAFALGDRAATWLSGLPGHQAYLIDRAGHVERIGFA